MFYRQLFFQLYCEIQTKWKRGGGNWTFKTNRPEKSPALNGYVSGKLIIPVRVDIRVQKL